MPTLISEPNYINTMFASFNNISILNQSGQKVNVLKMRDRYTIEFNVTMNQDSKNIFFGVQILDIKGVLISGVNTKDYSNFNKYTVLKDEIYNLFIEFDCLITHGVYIVKLFVSNDDEASIAHDAYIFKVNQEDFKHGGKIDLNQTIKVNLIK